MADRTVTVKLNADVKGFTSALTAAQAGVKALQQELREPVVIKVDVDAAGALSQLQALQAEIGRIDGQSARIDVDADTGAATSQLGMVDAEVSRLDGKRARVDVDANVGGALASIAMVIGALAAIPAVTTVAVSVGVLGGALTAAGAAAAGFAAVAVPSLGRISEALKAQESAAKSAGGATGGAGQSAAQAAIQSLQLEAAEKRLADAQKDERQAQEDLTRAREAGRRALEDLNFSLDRSILSQKDAALAVKEAAARMAEVNADSESTDLERERAALSYEMALQRQEEQETKTARARKDTAAANKAGVTGTKEYTRAQDDLTQAQDKVSLAEQQLKMLHLQQQAAMSGSSSGASKLADAFAGLSKEEKALAKDIKKSKDEYVDWQRSLQPDVFPAIRSGLDLMSTGMKIATPLVKASGKAFKSLLDDMNDGLQSEQWTSFFDDLAETAPRAIEGLGTSAGNVAGGLAGVIQAFLPYTDDLMTFLEDATQGFEDWGQSLKGSPEFEAFIRYVQEQGPKVAEVLGNVAEFAGKVVVLGAGVGSNLLDFLVTLSDKLAGMSPQQIEAIAKGVSLIFAAVKIGAALKLGALVLLAQVLSEMSPGQIQAVAFAIGALVLAVKSYQAVTGATEFFQNLSGGIDKAGKSADGAKGKLSNLAGMIGKGGVIAAAAAGTVLAVDSITDALDGLNPNLDEVAKGLAAFGKGGEPAAELLDQLDPKMHSLTGRFESFADSAARLTSNNSLVAFGNQLSGLIDDNLGLELDGGRQGIDNLDKALSSLVSNGRSDEAAAAFNRLARQALEAGTPMSKLKELFPEYASSLDGAIPKTADMAVAMGLLKVEVDPTAVAMDTFNRGLDEFNAKTDVAQRTLELKDAFDQAKKAIDEAGGKLDFSSRMTDKQREAVVLARDQFSGYIGKVLEAARAAGELAGKTGEAALKSDEARDAFIRQLPQLFDLAGKSKEARDRIYDMAAGFGVNKEQADVAAKGVDGVRKTIAELKGKKVDVGVDNKQGLDAVNALRLAILKLTAQNVTLKLQAIIDQNKAMGGINRYAAGGIERYASGGLRSTSPNLTSRPTILYGEGRGDEAFIPYDPAFRGEAEGLLAQVANDFGLSLNNQEAAQSLSDLSVTIDDSGMQISDRLTGVMGSLESTMGQAGSLTSSIMSVGASADQLSEGWQAGSDLMADSMTKFGAITADSFTLATESVDGLTSSVAELAGVIGTAAFADASGSKSKAKSSSKASSSKSKTKAGGVGVTATKMDLLLNPGGLVEGDYGLSGTPEWVSSAASALTTGSPVNSARVSAPQQTPAAYRSAGSSGSAASSGDASTAGRGGSLITVQTMNVSNKSDADAAAAFLYARLGSKGP